MNRIRNLGLKILIGAAFYSALLTGKGARADAFSDWLVQQSAASKRLMIENISAAGAAQGSVIASPSRQHPDYFFHWVRDASIIMDEVATLYASSHIPAEKNRYFKLLSDFLDFSALNQQTPNPSGGLGEPKFNADGTAFTGSWGRPQNDGPALRAIALLDFARQLSREGHFKWPGSKLQSVIRADLDFVAAHWQDTCFDPWEEVKGHHFFSRMVQRRGLLEGAQWFAEMGDPQTASRYHAQGKALEPQISRHWDPQRGYILATLDRDGGLDYKTSNLDSSVILGVLWGATADGFFGVRDARVVKTAQKIEITFNSLYGINHSNVFAPGIGRYPEDRFDGLESGAFGNPWILLTETLAELHYARGERQFGDAFLKTVQRHSDGQGNLSEELNRDTGIMQGAVNLSWSHAAFLTAFSRR